MSRYWDGRVRKVVSRRKGQKVHGGVTVLKLECGHEKAATTSGVGIPGQYAVCDECPEPKRGGR